MGLSYYWALECKYCGERVLSDGGPRGYSGISGDCDEHQSHFEHPVLGPNGVREVKAELGSYDDVRELFVEEEDDGRLLELAGEA